MYHPCFYHDYSDIFVYRFRSKSMTEQVTKYYWREAVVFFWAVNSLRKVSSFSLNFIYIKRVSSKNGLQNLMIKCLNSNNKKR